MTLARATIYGTYGGQGHINVLHFQRDDVTNIIWLGLGDKVDQFWVDTHRGNVDGNMSWQRIHLEDLSTGKTAYDWPISRTGVLGPSAAFCPFVSVCFLFQTAFAGRRGRGRSYQGGYNHGSFFQSGQWNTSGQTRIDNVAAALKADWVGGSVNTNGWALVVAPRTATSDSDSHDVTNIVARARVSTMVSRKIGHGL